MKRKAWVDKEEQTDCSRINSISRNSGGTLHCVDSPGRTLPITWVDPVHQKGAMWKGVKVNISVCFKDIHFPFKGTLKHFLLKERTFPKQILII